MNTETLATLEQMQVEMESLIEDELARHTDRELLGLVDQHINNPLATTAAASVMQSPKIAILAGCMIRRVLIRRLEAKAMEEVV